MKFWEKLANYAKIFWSLSVSVLWATLLKFKPTWNNEFEIFTTLSKISWQLFIWTISALSQTDDKLTAALKLLPYQTPQRIALKSWENFRNEKLSSPFFLLLSFVWPPAAFNNYLFRYAQEGEKRTVFTTW